MQGLAPDEIDHLTKLLEWRVFSQGQIIVKAGDEAGEIFFIHRGKAKIAITLASGVEKRLGLFTAGMAFGEVAMLDRARRSATVVAESEVECHVLRREDFEALGETHPKIKITLLTNMALGLSRLLRKATLEFSIFDY